MSAYDFLNNFVIKRTGNTLSYFTKTAYLLSRKVQVIGKHSPNFLNDQMHLKN